MTTSKFFRIFTAVFMTLSVVLGMFAGITPAFAMAHVDRNTDDSAPVATTGYLSPVLPINAPFYGDTGWKGNKSISGSLTNLEDNAFDTCVPKNSGDRDELSGLKRTFERQGCKYFIGSK